MFKKLLLTLALLPSLALAQTAPTRPTSDNSNSIATTAFVQNTLAAPLTGPITSISNGGGPASAFVASGTTGAALDLQVTTAGTDQKNWDFLASTTALNFRAVNDANNAFNSWMTVTRGVGATVSGVSMPQPLTLAPPAASVTQGLNIAQSGPTSGTQTGTTSQCYGNLFIVYNQICVIGEATNATSVATETTTAIGLVMGGANSQGTKTAAQVSLLANTASNPTVARDRIALNVISQDQAGDGGTNTGAGAKGDVFAMGIGAHALSGATNLGNVSGAEVDVGINTGASSARRLGWSLVDNGNLQGVSADAAFEIGAATGAPGWKTGIIISNFHGANALSSTGCVICTDGTADTITTGFDLSAYTVTGNFLAGPQTAFVVTGSGNVFGHYSSRSPANTIGTCTGLGTTGTCAKVSGSSDNAGQIILSPSGTGTAGTGNVTITFGLALGLNNVSCTFASGNSGSVWTQPATFTSVTTSTTAFTFAWFNNSVALTAGGTYLINYICMGF